MNETLFLAILGHFVGDFFFQNKTMIERKYKKGIIGVTWCSIHVCVYTVVVCLFIQHISLLLFLGIFIPHWIIDHWSLAHKWMKLSDVSKRLESTDPIQQAFGVAMYMIIDQTMHIGTLYALLKLI